ncbi:hypothetical protein CEXT_622141 [Caerostris extrusa]|uniref:Uncharacterized protein n=1 Tax=Caerostris extrusa TaxID=172846 RepID=A0AAV4NPH4_CAEEX|nr:hypothetical protein CEXT_622141 [Caerostris extrusa]
MSRFECEVISSGRKTEFDTIRNWKKHLCFIYQESGQSSLPYAQNIEVDFDQIMEFALEMNLDSFEEIKIINSLQFH